MRRIRYAVVGLGNITQDALLPAFKNAKNSELAALVTSDLNKGKKIAEQYRLKPDSVYKYENFEACLRSGRVDAAYIGLPNHMHCDYTIRAAKARVHVFCEKPMAIDEGECKKMIRACRDASVKLMIAYRLHFEEANLELVEIAKSGKLGEVRIFTSAFSQQVVKGNIRLTQPESRGGGGIYDLGVYCINAARYLFRDEPIEVFATSASAKDARFRLVPEMTAVTLRFPRERLATFISSFGADAVSEFTLIGSKAWVRLSPAYSFHKPLVYDLMSEEKRLKHQKFAKRDQFGSQLVYFSNCILRDRSPEPSGEEGLADIRIIQAILKSARSGKTIKLRAFEKRRRPTKQQKIKMPAVKHPKLISAERPTK